MPRVLRDDADVARSAGLGLDELPEMVERAASSRVPVELTIEGPARLLPPTLDTTAYGIVQEALTNALRHADASRIEVGLRYAVDTLHVHVTDDGAGRTAAGPATGGGFGLAGVRERVAVFEGEFCAGPRDDRPGWQVAAALPLGPAGT